MHSQLFCVCCVSIVHTSNMGLLHRALTHQPNEKERTVVSKCNADVLLTQGNNPALVCIEYFLLQTHGSIVWKSPPQPLVQPPSWSKTIANTDAGQTALSNQHSEAPKGGKPPPL